MILFILVIVPKIMIAIALYILGSGMLVNMTNVTLENILLDCIALVFVNEVDQLIYLILPIRIRSMLHTATPYLRREATPESRWWSVMKIILTIIVAVSAAVIAEKQWARII